MQLRDLNSPVADIMDPGHHTAFLLAILICILLLLLAVSAVALCFWRNKCFNVKTQSSMRLKRQRKDQATSMSNILLNAIELKPLNNGFRSSTAVISMPVMVDQACQKSNLDYSCLSLESNFLGMSDDEVCSQTGYTSPDLSGSVRKNASTKKMSTLDYILLSGASVLGNVLDKSSKLSIKSKRRSSSMKSGLDPDVLLAPMESPVAASSIGQYRTASLPRELSRGILMYENSNDQQFTWNTAELSGLNNHVGQTESLSVPATLERKSHLSAYDPVSQNVVQLKKPATSPQPKAWFVSVGKRPQTLGAQVVEREFNNVASLDSGVDIIEVPARQGCDGLKNDSKKQTFQSLTGGCHLLDSPDEQDTADAECFIHVVDQPAQEVQISHQEAARKLNGEHYSRSLWQKWEDRPLIVVN